jgi:hypothetical protein
LTKVKTTITKQTNAIFLLVVLVTGTFAAVYPSSFSIGDVQAQIADYGYKDKNGYNSKEYPQDYGYDKKYYPPNKDPPADIVVPRDFPKIQQAINAAEEGDVIKVLPGIYTEQLTISKSLTLLGSGEKSTIIEAPEVLETNVLEFTYIVETNKPDSQKDKKLIIRLVAELRANNQQLTSLGMVTPIIATIKNIIEDKEKII